MSDIDRAPTLLLDAVWPLVDVKGTGFIYGRDFPLAVSKMEELLNKGHYDNSKSTLVSKTGQEILKKFSSDQEFFKVYKDDFAELFHGLIGTAFRTAVQSCSREGWLDFIKTASETVSFNDNEDTPVEPETLRGEIAALKSQIGELRRQNAGKDKTIATNEVLLTELRNSGGSPSASPTKNAGTRSLRARISELLREVQARDEAIRYKDRELLSMTKKVGEYRDKYQFLEREFQFYKDHGELQKPEATKEATKHEFIISELRRKITDQSDMINAMRSQVESKNPLVSHPKPAGVESSIIDLVPVQKILKCAMAIIGIFIVANVLLYFVAALKSVFGSSSAQGINPQIQLNWWERSSMLSKIVWYFSEYFEQDWSIAADENINSSYNKIFGV
ncbi:Mps2p LALA0_S05e05842g [Lachancea lanzarotensis]|uniref:Monopolar spindle protein 2 n=1 Tax=Lachancea lanzarotensis TaxID=1245769 RepID=A0A0C7NAD6_9SACH|nr:uncharacterized protein LALA0_S05e05842g [Lachancea lanzarotensis]CEP62446.1 LALA0S05e05842g1_1 [Lachancea lanzarotensis]